MSIGMYQVSIYTVLAIINQKVNRFHYSLFSKVLDCAGTGNRPLCLVVVIGCKPIPPGMHCIDIVTRIRWKKLYDRPVKFSLTDKFVRISKSMQLNHQRKRTRGGVVRRKRN